jgi:chromosome segregation ATPase
MKDDIIETARAAGVHPLAMSEEYLPGLERLVAALRQEEAAHIYRLRDEITQQEIEMQRLRQQIERLTLNSIHSCHAECQRPVCRLTWQRDALLEALKFVIRGVPDTWEGVQKARAAIAAVEGEKK